MMPSFIKDFDDESNCALILKQEAINNTQLDIQINQIRRFIKRV